ncbi:MAG: TrkA family potassium uptake protein [Acidimicrobiia bacterium]
MRILLLGCGRVGSGLAYRLEIDRHEVTVVDADKKALDRLGRGFTGTALVGDALDRKLLERAGIADVDALAAVTGNDEVNAVAARLAVRHFHVPRVVARMYEPRQAELYRKLGVLTISPVEWGVTRLAQLLTVSELARVGDVGGGNVQLLEARIPPSLGGRTAEELEIPGEVRVVAVTRSASTQLASRSSTLESGDMVTVAVVTGAERRLEELLGKG